MRRFLYLWEYAIRSFWRKKGKNLGLSLFLSLIVFVFTGIEFTQRAYLLETERALHYQPDLIVQRVLAGRQLPVSGRYIDRIRELIGVSEVKGRVWGYYFDPFTGANYTLLGDPGDLVQSWQLVTTYSGTLGPKEALVGEGVLRIRRLRVGDYLNLRSWQGRPITLKIKGTFRSPVSLWTYDLIVVSEATAREILGLPQGEYWDLAVWIPNELEVPKVGEKILRFLPEGRLVARSQLWRTYGAAFGFRSGLLMALAAFVMLAFIIIAYEKASGLSREEQYEIAVLKAVGWLTRDVIWLKMFQNLLVSLLGFVVGVVASYYHVFIWGAPGIKRLLAGWSVIYPPHPLPAHLDLGKVLAFLFFTVVPFLAASIVPVWRSAIRDPEEVFRSL